MPDPPLVSGGLAQSIKRYAIAGIGPVAGAVAQFALSLLLLRQLDVAAFGSFQFLLVTSYFATGLWNALFCAPMPVLLTDTAVERRSDAIHCLFAINLAGAGISFALFVVVALALAVPAGAALMFGLYAVIYLLRWFARAYAYATGQQLRTTASDLVFALALLLGVALCWLVQPRTLDLFYGVLTASAVLGLLPFGFDYFRQQFGTWRPGAVREYLRIWRTHAGWSVVGVISTEATVNAHVYLVIAMSGAAAYAPIAATALLIRPIGVAQNALTEFERAHMARNIGAGRASEALRSVAHFRLALMTAFLVTAIGVICLLCWAPRLVFPDNYPLDVLVIGSGLWLAVAGLRSARTPSSVLLQAAGRFRALADASLVSCGFSVAGVAALLILAGPVWSIGGILAGEAVIALFIARAAAAWRHEILASATA